MESMGKKIRGRGTANNVDPRYMEFQREGFDDDWDAPSDEKRVGTTVTEEIARTIISRNTSPDIPFEQSINPYRGCEHGCNYCYARPSHAYLDLSPGIDFETKLFAKPNAAELLRNELTKPGYICKPIALGTNTDPYQPVEREYKITRSIVAVLNECQHPLTIVTKSRLIQRDMDLLKALAEKDLVQVFISVTTLNTDLAQKLEPRASAPYRRVETIRRLSDAGIPVGLMFAPVIPCVNDAEMEQILDTCADAGAETAGYIMLRLPHEVKELFREWLAIHMPLKKDHIMSLINDIREGKDYDANFRTRMRGTGVFATMIRKRFELRCNSLGLNRKRRDLVCDIFQASLLPHTQQSLF
ncbi:MAG: DNA repair photolyase [Gammaproteobacteria bacterium]